MKVLFFAFDIAFRVKLLYTEPGDELWIRNTGDIPTLILT